MPIYEYECLWGGGKFELILSKDKASLKEVPCSLQHPELDWSDPGVYHQAEKVWSLTANVQIGAPTIVFKNPLTGIAQIATSRYDSPPPGFIKEEIRGSIERSKFENEQNKLASFEDEVYNANREIERELLRKSIIDDANANSSIDAAQSDNPSATEHLMKKAIEHIRKKPTLRRKRKTEFRLDVNHLDKSNLK